MSGSDDSSPTLGAFLRAARSRASTDRQDFMTDRARRRVPGLRREEVAVLAGMSVNYYTRLEQGRERHPSAQVLDALARSLDLDADESQHLRTLVDRPRSTPAPQVTVRPALRHLLEAWDHTPVIVLGEALDILEANALARAMHSGFVRADNLAAMTFLDPHARHFYVDWADAASATVANLRFALGRRPHDSHLTGLIGALSARSAEFERMWTHNAAGGKTFADKRFQHPDVGLLELTYQAFDVRGASGQQLLAYAAEPHSRTAASLRLLSSLHHPATKTADVETDVPPSDDRASRI
jgi:transcriptional regulator with XRE-family HTH domain